MGHETKPKVGEAKVMEIQDDRCKVVATQAEVTFQKSDIAVLKNPATEKPKPVQDKQKQEGIAVVPDLVEYAFRTGFAYSGPDYTLP